jgi:uncharacterized protein (TIGR00730 family)
MNTICVYCGSRVGASETYRLLAQAMGTALVERQIGLVYGGGRVGLMGVIADTVMAAGGTVIGVIPEALDLRESKHTGITELHVVPNMHTRKALMAEKSDAFIAMPGGYGTLEELFEAITWLQLGIHRKPVGILNAGSFYDPLIAMIDHAIAEGFIDAPNRDLVHVDTDPNQLLDRLAAFDPDQFPPKWSGVEP